LLHEVFPAGGAQDTKPVIVHTEDMASSCLSGALPFAPKTQLLGLPA